MRRSTAWLLVGLMVLAWACGGEGDGAEASDVATAETETDGTHPRRRRGGHGRGNHPLRGRASVITASGGRLVEMAIVFLLIDPDDTARIEEAAAFAVTALSRWD